MVQARLSDRVVDADHALGKKRRTLIKRRQKMFIVDCKNRAVNRGQVRWRFVWLPDKTGVAKTIEQDGKMTV